MTERLPPNLQDSIRSPLTHRGWEVYLFNPQSQRIPPAPEIDYDDSYTIFPPIEGYRGQFAITSRMQIPQITIYNKKPQFAWRKRTFSKNRVDRGFTDFVDIPSKFTLVLLYFVPRERNIEVHVPRTVFTTDDGVIDIDGLLLPYNSFFQSMETLQPVE